MNQGPSTRGTALKKVFRRGNTVTCSLADRDDAVPFQGEVVMLSFNSVTIQSVHLDLNALPRPDTLLAMEIVTPDGFYASKGTYAGSARPGEIRIQITEPPAKIERRGLLRVACDREISWRLLGGPETAPLVANAAIACGEILPRLRIDAYPELVSLLNAMVQRIDLLENELEALQADAERAAASIPDIIENLSGHGLLFRTRRKVSKSDKIEATFSLDHSHSEPITVDCVVRRVVDTPDRLGRVAVGCEFVGLNVGMRDHLVNWVMEKNRQTVRSRPDRG
jgi:hypothetical protein